MFCAGFASMPISFSNSRFTSSSRAAWRQLENRGDNWARSPAQSGTAGERALTFLYHKRSTNTFQPNNGVHWTLVYNPLAQRSFGFSAVSSGLEHCLVEELHGTSQLSCHVFRTQHYLSRWRRHQPHDLPLGSFPGGHHLDWAALFL